MYLKNRHWKLQPNLRDANYLINKKVPEYCMTPIILYMSYK